jgi:cysteine synthase
MIYDNILGTIGRTPVVRVQRLAPKHVTLYAKCEFFNPLSSVKDRLAIAIIEDAERTGTLKPGQTVVEATSGNTGIALAMVCAAKGYPFVAIMTETFSVERRRLMRMLGAKVILTPAAERGSGMVRKAAQLGEAWLVPGATVRERGQSRLSPQHDRPGDPLGLRRPAPRLLHHRLGYGRNADGCRRDDPARTPGG